MVKIGMIINDRYEIIEKIGTGGMSDVYKALDTKLNRNVAVKVLKAEFGENENFVSKFRVEAQAAAGLMHSNIVNVYDVGEENDIHYIVMELVEGITLKKYIEKKARLTYKEAVSIAIQVSLGIESAHAARIIHRDIKPQNIIISRDGKVKVTDFGIAKAATSNTITSNVMGSVHYTSPEQARGGYSDEKSDIYSLGITMFEMLTGRVPFNGETTVAIAIKHIQEPMPSPREYVPEIPKCVESIIFKCCEKSPDRRYQSMGDLIKDLKQALLTPDVDFVVRDEQDILGGTRTVTDEDMAKIKSSSSARVYDEDDSHMMKLAPGATGSLPKEEYYENNYSGESYEEGYNEGEYSSDYQNGEYESDGYREEGYETEGYNDAYNEVYNSESGLENEEDYNPKMEKITTIIAIAAGVIIVGIIIVLAVTIIGKMGSKTPAQPADTQTETTSPVIAEDEEQPTVEMVKLPAMVGKDIDSVRNELFALGLTVNPVYEESSTVDAGLVIEADGVSEGSEVQKGTIINLKVSSGVSGIQIPAVAGATYESAVNALTKAGFNVTKIEQFDDNIAEGYVVGVIPEVGSTVPKGSTIQIIVSKGVENTTVKVPNVVGIPTEDALAKLIEAGLTVGKTTSVNSDTIEKDMICQQGVTADTYVEKGTAVDLQISLGPKAVTYKYEAEIAAPSATEAPDYVSGVTVSFVVKDGNGKAFIEASTVSFPYKPATCYGITTAEGTIEFTYDVVKQTESTDAEGNKVINTTTEKKTFTRPVTFVQE